MPAHFAIIGLSVVLSAILCSGSAGAQPRSSADIDLGTATLGQGEVAVGPTKGAIGAFDWLMIGSYTVPWAIAFLDRGSAVPNAFGKLELARFERVSVSARSALFYLHFDDLDRDGLNARAIISNNRASLAGRLSPRLGATAEINAVFVRAAADRPSDQDTEVHGVALANTVHVAGLLRYRLRRRFTLWSRARLVILHDPVVVEGGASLSPDSRLEIRARANAAELATVGSVMIGGLYTWRSMSVRLGVGYGHWVLPWIGLPVGHRLVSGDFDLYWRF